MWELILILIVALFTGCYVALIYYYRDLFQRLQPIGIKEGEPATRFSILVPARNEEENIAQCIESVYRQEYPRQLFEVIVIDDHSTDNTAGIVQYYQASYPTLKLIKLADTTKGKLLNAYKKKAIDTAIPQSTGEWIITTDADCVMDVHWLGSYDSYIREKDPVMVAGPVKFTHNGSLVSLFQCLDFLSLQGITAAAVSANKHSMCNGANLAYRKDAFAQVNGFKGIDSVASGDDMLLMHKIKKQFPGRIGYLFNKEAVVSTAPMPGWKSFFNQRIRWASKAEKYDDKSIIAVLVLVYFYNVMLLTLAILSAWIGFCFPLLIASIVAKTVAELSFMLPVAGFYKEKKLLWWFPFMQPLHIIYMVVAGWLGKFGSYRWKGRKVR